MKIVICGAGQVGFHLARYLSADGNDVTVIDNSAEVIHQVGNHLDVQGIVGSAAHPDVLMSAGVEHAEMLIAVTQQDEINMMACQVAYSLFKTPTKIARIRDQCYLNPRWAGLFNQENVPVDFIISPEMEVARSIERTLRIPGSFEAFDLASGMAKAIGVRAMEGMPILRTPLRHLKTLFPDLDISVIGIVRDQELIMPAGDDVILPHDSVYFIVHAKDVRLAMQAFDYAMQDVQRVVLLGSGGIGLRLAEGLGESSVPIEVIVVEKDRQRASLVAQEVPKATVLHGDALNAEILKEAGIKKADTVVSITNDDKINILSALLAKSLGAGQAISLVNEIFYSALIFPLGVDALISPRAITVSSILQYIRRGRVRMAYAIQGARGEIVDIEVFPESLLIGRELKDLDLSKKSALVAAVARGHTLLSPKPTLILEPGDRLLMMIAPEAIKRVERIFSARI